MEIRVPPHDTSAEEALLGAILLRPIGIYDITDTVKPEMFYSPRHELIFSSMLAMSRQGIPIDLVSLNNYLKEKELLDECGGATHISELVANVPSTLNIKHYAKIVFDKSVLRKLIGAGTKITDSGYDESRDVTSLVENAGVLVLGLSDMATQENTDISSSVTEFDSIQNEFKEKQFADVDAYIGIPTGFSKIDKTIDGLRKGHMWVVGGYTSTGKTWWSLNVVNNIMMETPVTFFSLEMSKPDIVSRMLAIQSGIGSTKIQRHEFSSPQELEKYGKARERLLSSKLKICASLKMTLDEMILAMTRDIIKNKTRVFVIDYIQQIRVGNKEEYGALTEISTTLQAFALKTNTTIITLSQISNEGAKEQSREHMVFKGSGAIAASADYAIQLFHTHKKEERLQRLRDGLPLLVEVAIMKNRHGAIGEVDMEFTPWNGRFEQDLF